MTSAGCCFSARPVPAGSSAAVVSSRPCAGRIVCRLRLPAAALFRRLRLPVHLCHALIHAHVHFAPLCFDLPPPLVHFHVRRDRRKLQELSRWQLQHGPAEAARAPVHVLTLTFFLQSP